MPIYPARFPHDLLKKPWLLGEALVYTALQSALDSAWHIFYDWHVPGARRRVDFLCIDPARGVAAFEVKGGLVQKRRAHFVQRIYRNGTRKRIFPFDQVKSGVNAVLCCCHVAPAVFPLHLSIFFPAMSLSAFPWREGAHFFTCEDLEPARLWSRIAPSLPTIDNPPAAAAMRGFIADLTRRRRSRTFVR
jgi:hypothetical protein